MADLSEDTELNIPLKNLIAMIAVTGLATTLYFGMESRLTNLEYQTQMILEEVEENDTWIDGFEPPPEVQDTILRVRNLETKVAQLEIKLQNTEK